MRITQSTLSNADKCMLSAQYNLDRPSWYKRAAGSTRALGTAYHAGLERYYRERIESPGLLPDLAEMIAEARRIFNVSTTVDLYDNTPVEVFRWDEKVPDVETAHRLLDELLTFYVLGGHVWPAEWAVLGVEVDQLVALPDLAPHTAKLGADLVLVDPNGWVVLVDHKTAGKAWAEGKHHPRKNDQASLYTHLARQVWPDAPGHRFVFDIITLPGAKSGPKFERRISDPQPAHEAAVVKKAKDFASLYEIVHVQHGLDLPANPASTLCNPKWCDFFDGCPHGASLD